nr:HNH endonuclease signature motif containing protein [uncultured Cellulosilyticum sp.]
MPKREYGVTKKHRGSVHTCANCGSTENIEFHHIVPLCNGGLDVLTNIVPLCKECHFKAHGKIYKKRPGKCGGRPPKISYEEACTWIDKYINCEITIPQLKEKLQIKSKDSSINDIRSFKRYVKESNISKEQLDKARKSSAYKLTGYRNYT